MRKRYKLDRYFDEGLRGWVVNTAKRNYWRVAAWHELEDLIQEGMLAYAICSVRYASTVENKSHFMALVKTAYLHRIADLANARTRTMEIALSQIVAEGKDDEALELLSGVTFPEAEMVACLLSAPREVRAYLAAISDPDVAKRLRSPYRKRLDGTRETTKERMSRVIGMDMTGLRESLREQLEAVIG